MSKRELAVVGQFYPDSKDELDRYLNHFNNVLEQNNIKIDNSVNSRAIIVPHAGYIYSGFTANLAYQYIPNNIKNIIVIGPSHKFGFDGGSVALYDKYPTPYGDLDINQELSNELVSKYDFLNFTPQVHCEHSTEVQFPFIKRYKSSSKVVEIVYSDINYTQISQVVQDLLKDKDNFIVISTDLSHFYDLKKANKLDNICIKSILNYDLDIQNNGCEACGMLGVKAMIDVSKNLNLTPIILDYRTSCDTSNDSSSVVGYLSVLLK